MLNKERMIFLMLTAVVMIWGLNVVMVKYLSFFPPILIATIRMTVAALCLSPVLFLKKEKTKIAKKDWLLIACIGLTSVTLHQILLAWGVQHTTAGTASLILGLNPLATALMAMLFLGESMTKRKAIGACIGFGGVVLVVTSQSGEVSLSGWGDAIIFASMIMYVVGGLLIRKATTRKVPVLVITAYSQLVAATLLWIISAAVYPIETLQAIDTRPFTWLVIIASGGLSTALGGIGWAYGIRQLGASRTAIFLNGMPLASLITAAIFLGEPLQLVHGLAFIMVVVGVYLGSRQPVTTGQPLVIPNQSLKA